jgi:hypothetical protein
MDAMSTNKAMIDRMLQKVAVVTTVQVGGCGCCLQSFKILAIYFFGS